MNESENSALRSWLADIASDVLETQTTGSADAGIPSGPAVGSPRRNGLQQVFRRIFSISPLMDH